MKRVSCTAFFKNLTAMTTNSWWIRTDYWVQTVIGVGILVSAVTVVGIYFSLLLLIPLGAWQVVSGLVAALKNDRLQQIYLGVVAVYFGFCYLIKEAYDSSLFVFLMIIAVVIGVWKYTVVRADYKSLDIVTIQDLDNEDLLDA